MSEYDDWSDEKLKETLARYQEPHPLHQIADQVLARRRQAAEKRAKFLMWVPVAGALAAWTAFLAGRFFPVHSSDPPSGLVEQRLQQLEHRMLVIEQSIHPTPSPSLPLQTATPQQSPPAPRHP